jgi:hypothetical protein
MNNTDQQIIAVKQLRQDGDRLIQSARDLNGSREVSIVITKLQEAVMWAGMELKRINDSKPGTSPNPYPNSKDPTNTKIEPTSEGLKL